MLDDFGLGRKAKALQPRHFASLDFVQVVIAPHQQQEDAGGHDPAAKIGVVRAILGRLALVNRKHERFHRAREREAEQFCDIGAGAAVAVVIFGCLLTFSIFFLKYISQEEGL